MCELHHTWSFTAEADTLALVSRASSEFRLEVPPEGANRACKEAIAGLGWMVESAEPQRIVTKTPATFKKGKGSRTEVLITESGPEAANITLNGRVSLSLGPLVQRQLKAEMEQLRNAIEVAARRSPEPQSS